VKERRADWSD